MVGVLEPLSAARQGGMEWRSWAVVVVNYGSSSLLSVNLAQVADACPGATVVVVDNPTSNEERERVSVLASRYGWQLLAPDSNLGFGAGVNAGVAHSCDMGARAFLVINPDARIDAASAALLRTAVEREPNTLVSPRVLDEHGRVWFDGADLYLADGRTAATRNRPAETRSTEVFEWISGACFAVSRELWDDVGGFDERYFLYWEDVDLSWRIRQHGGGLRVVREATAMHNEGGTQKPGAARGRSNVYYYYNIRNRILFAQLHLPPDQRLRWKLRALFAARDILLRGGRRQFARPLGPLRAAAGGTFDGFRTVPVLASGAVASSYPVRVLQSFPQPRPTTNPYIVMLKESLEGCPGVAVQTFTWRRALTDDYRVFHAHWPEILVDGRTPLRKLARQCLFAALLARLAARRVAVVRTVHNLELPQGISRRETFLLRKFDDMTTFRILLNDSTHLPEGFPSATILHGHYRDWFSGIAPSERVLGRIAFVGLIRRYKGVVSLVEAFVDVPSEDASLHVSGKPSSPELARTLQTAANGDRRVSLRFEFLSDEDLVAEVSAAQLVVFPYQEMHNSGGVLAVLSLGRPVLVPQNEVNSRLAEEVGAAWVLTYDGPLSTDRLMGALAVTKELPKEPPNLGARDWREAGAAHLSAYQLALTAQASASPWP